MENATRFDLEYETMPWHRVDAVVFDIGNILIRYAPKDFLEQLFPGDAQKQQEMMVRPGIRFPLLITVRKLLDLFVQTW